jgi:hypothetical protein
MWEGRMLVDPEKKMEARQSHASNRRKMARRRREATGATAQATVQAKTKGRGPKPDGKIPRLIAIHKKNTDAVAETDGKSITINRSRANPSLEQEDETTTPNCTIGRGPKQDGQVSTVAAIHNRTTDLDIDSIDHEADSSFGPEDEMTPQVQMKRKGQKQYGMTAIYEDNKSESETSRRQLRFDCYRDTSSGRSSLDSSSLEDDNDSESSPSHQGKQENEFIIAAFTALAVDDDDNEEVDETKGTPRHVDLAEGRITREVEFPPGRLGMSIVKTDDK